MRKRGETKRMVLKDSAAGTSVCPPTSENPSPWFMSNLMGELLQHGTRDSSVAKMHLARESVSRRETDHRLLIFLFHRINCTSGEFGRTPSEFPHLVQFAISNVPEGSTPSNRESKSIVLSFRATLLLLLLLLLYLTSLLAFTLAVDRGFPMYVKDEDTRSLSSGVISRR